MFSAVFLENRGRRNIKEKLDLEDNYFNVLLRRYRQTDNVLFPIQNRESCMSFDPDISFSQASGDYSRKE